MVNVSLQVAKRGLITIPKHLRDSYGIQPGDNLTLIDLGGVFVLTPEKSQIDLIAERIQTQWKNDGQTLESMMAQLKEYREKNAT